MPVWIRSDSLSTFENADHYCLMPYDTNQDNIYTANIFDEVMFSMQSKALIDNECVYIKDCTIELLDYDDTAVEGLVEQGGNAGSQLLISIEVPIGTSKGDKYRPSSFSCMKELAIIKFAGGGRLPRISPEEDWTCLEVIPRFSKLGTYQLRCTLEFSSEWTGLQTFTFGKDVAICVVGVGCSEYPREIPAGYQIKESRSQYDLIDRSDPLILKRRYMSRYSLVPLVEPAISMILWFSIRVRFRAKGQNKVSGINSALH